MLILNFAIKSAFFRVLRSLPLILIGIAFTMMQGCISTPRMREGAPAIELPLQQSVFKAYDKVKGVVVHLGLFPEGDAKNVKFANGILLNKDGLVLTLHEITGFKGKILASDTTDAIYDAEVYRTDERSGLGLVKLKNFKFKKSLHKIVDWGDSDDVVAGQSAMIGSCVSGSININLSLGIISCVKRSRTMRYQEGKKTFGSETGWFQTDAAINPSENGAPLFDLEGEVIGICVYPHGQKRQGDDLGFAIPSNYAELIIKKLADLPDKDAKIKRAFIGLVPQAYYPLKKEKSKINPELALSDKDRGFVIKHIVPGKAAHFGGLKKGDLVTSVDGNPIIIRHPDEMYRLTRQPLMITPGEEVVFKIYRDKKLLEKTVVPLDVNVYSSDYFDSFLGLYLVVLNEERMRDFNLPYENGLWINGSRKDSPAAKAKIGSSKHLLKINNIPITTLEDYKKVIEKLKAKSKESEDETVSTLVEIEYKKRKEWQKEKKVLEWKK
jgi:S1-C subfamily serine protease